MTEQELQHHGILGMKWGIRRFQNRDGTLTAAGKKRAANGDSDAPKKKSVKELSDAELKSRNDRLRMEDEYRRLSAKDKEASVSRGQRIVGELFSKAGMNIGGQLATYFLGQATNEVAKRIVRNVGSQTVKDFFGNGGNIVNPKKGQKD